ncbi:hypothetical protein BpHYR1_047304 [Brachionus plicatilis]|uniref:Uncharacterized protein n=1 Tax=Brachionus plicatilis TaxID=10195 RepID=A0A3M7T0K5_BRAPC|nr:hypothetical protein BpHYR1_047304 [Brachionus plicatilis]
MFKKKPPHLKLENACRKSVNGLRFVYEVGRTHNIKGLYETTLEVVNMAKRYRQSFNYEFPISMAQSINQDPLSNENDNDQDQAESINNDIQTIFFNDCFGANYSKNVPNLNK